MKYDFRVKRFRYITAILLTATLGVHAGTRCPVASDDASYPRTQEEDTAGVISEEYWMKWNAAEQARIDSDIEKYRKADAEILLADCKPGTEVKVELVRHAFVFGAQIFNFNQLGDKEANERYRNLFGSLFNRATIPFYWKDFEPEVGKLRYATAPEDTEEFWNSCPEPYLQLSWRRPSTDQIVEFCKAKGVGMHGHVLIWGSRLHNPEWMESYMNDDERKLYNELIVERATRENRKGDDVFGDRYKLMSAAEVYALFSNYIDRMGREFDRRIYQLAEHYGNTLPSWDVVNESAKDFEAGSIVPGEKFCKSKYGFMPGDYPYRALSVAAKAFPRDVALNINDYRMSQGYADQVRELIDRGAKIDIVGAQMHLFDPQNCLDIAAGKDLQTPRQIRDWMEILGSNDRPVHLSEITITSPGDDERGRTIQAVIARNLYRLWFSNEKMMGITWWNVVDGCGMPGEPGNSGLFDRQMNPKTSFFALDDLINKEWHTSLAAVPGDDGILRFRGFKGKYRLTYMDRADCMKSIEYELK